MNKKFFFAAVLLFTCSYFALVSFKGKTKAQQLQEIAAAVETKVSDLRTQRTADCDAMVNSAARMKADEILASKAAEKAALAAKPGVKKAVVKKPSTPKATTPTAPRVEPIPAPAAPTPNPKSSKTAGEAPVNTEAKASKTAGEAPASNTNQKKSKTAGTTKEGGN